MSLDADHAREWTHRYAERASALRVPPDEGPGKNYGVARVVARSEHTFARQLRHDFRNLRGGEQLAVDATAILQLDVLGELRRAGLAARQEQIAPCAKPGVD